MLNLFFLITSFWNPDFENLNLMNNKVWICPDRQEQNIYHYMPAYLSVSEEYHGREEETQTSIYKFKVTSPITEKDIDLLSTRLGDSYKYDDGMISFTLGKGPATLYPMPMQKMEVTLFKRRGNKPFDYSIPLEKTYFSGDLTHWAIPSHIILRVPLEFEPEFGNIINCDHVLPYQYLITVAPNVTIPLFISKGETHE